MALTQKQETLGPVLIGKYLRLTNFNQNTFVKLWNFFTPTQQETVFNFIVGEIDNFDNDLISKIQERINNRNTP